MKDKKRIGIVFPFKPVEGDYRALTPEGKGVLIEVKTIDDGNLKWSSFKEHQREALTEHSKYSLSLVVFVFNQTPEYAIMQWPIPGFKKYSSITPERAIELSITELSQCRPY